VDEVIAQLTAERSAGLADEPQLRPEATLNSTTSSSSTSAAQQPQAGPAIVDIAAAADAPPQQYMQSLVEAPAAAEPAVAPADDALSAFDAMMLPPSAGAADAAASWAAPAAAAAAAAPSTQEAADLQHPTIADCVAAVEEPLVAAAEAVEEDEAPDAAMAAFDHMAVEAPPAPAAQEAADLQHPTIADCVAAVEEPLVAAAEAVEVDEAPDSALSAFDHMAVEAPPAPAAQEAADLQHPTIADCVAAVEEPLMAAAEAVEEDEAPDSALSAFDHMAVDAPPAPAAQEAAAGTDGQHPTFADCVAAVEEPLAATADAVEEDEAPDAAMAAFDHTPLDSPAAAAVADGNQSPSLADIVLAVEPSSLPPSLEGSLGEDEEPDVALAAFDHMTPEAPRSEAAAVAAAPAAAAPAVVADETVGYDQAYLDPLQPSATVGSGSMDVADAAEPAPVVAAVAAAAAAAAPAPAASAVPAAAVAPKEQQRGSGADPADFGAMMQRWWSSVVVMFEEWQKNLAGPK